MPTSNGIACARQLNRSAVEQIIQHFEFHADLPFREGRDITREELPELLTLQSAVAALREIVSWADAGR